MVQETRLRPPPPPALPPQPREGQGKREAQGVEEEGRGGREEGGQQPTKRIKEEMAVEVQAPLAEVEVGGQVTEYREEAGVDYPLVSQHPSSTTCDRAFY